MLIIGAPGPELMIVANRVDCVSTTPSAVQRKCGQRWTLADAAPDRYRALVLVASFGGLRFGEAVGLRRRRIDVLRGRIEVTETLVDTGRGEPTLGSPKTKRGRRTVPLPCS